jgi:LCP family protein required for cell wall assembly
LGGVAKTIEERAAPARSGRSGPPRGGHHRWRLVALSLSATLALAIAAGGAYGYGVLWWAEDRWDRAAIDEGELADIGADSPCDPVCNYLILGSDSRAGLSPEEQAQHGSPETVEGERADTIILVHVDPAREKVVVVHFPRDLWVAIPGTGGEDRINAAFEAGPNRMVGTIEDLTGIELNHYVGVTLAGFEDTVDALGGVRLCVDRPMVDPPSKLDLPRAGCYDMDGETALAFVRARSIEGDCIPDFSRISRQQQFLRAVIGKLLSPSTFARLPSLVRATVANLPHDPWLDLTDLLALTNQLQGIDTGDVDFRAVPGAPGWEGDKSVVHIDQRDASLLFRRLREGRPLRQVGRNLEDTQLSPANVRVQVIGLSEQKGDRVRTFLGGAGFAVLGARPSPETVGDDTASVILYRPGREEAAQVLQRFLPGLEARPAPAGALDLSDAAVVVASDYEGPGLSTGGGGTPGSGRAPGARACD